jgi:hypothetical protein
MAIHQYSSVQEAKRIVALLLELVSLPPEIVSSLEHNVSFTSSRDFPYFPIPFKETELAAALKAIEGSVASALAGLQDESAKDLRITVNLERTTAFLFQAYLATVGGQGKLDRGVKQYLKGKAHLSGGEGRKRRTVADDKGSVLDDAMPARHEAYRGRVQIPTSSRHSQTPIDACQQIYTRPKKLASTTISMARSRRQLPWE